MRKNNAGGKSLVPTIRKELLRRKGDWAEITRETDLGYRWLMAFAHGKIKDPGVMRAQKLGKYLGLEIGIMGEPHSDALQGDGKKV